LLVNRVRFEAAATRLRAVRERRNFECNALNRTGAHFVSQLLFNGPLEIPLKS
jgi:hypothetical protein